MPPEAEASPGTQSISPSEGAAMLEEKLFGGSEQEQPGEDEAKPAHEPTEGSPEPPEEEQSQEQPQEEQQAEEGDDEPLEALEVDGTTYEVPQSLKKVFEEGFLRHRDYTQKTQQLAEHRRQVEQEATQVVQERQVYANLLGRLEEAIGQYNPQEPDWAALAQHPDPAIYWQQQALWNEHQRRLGAIKEEKDRLTQLQQMDFVQQLKGHLSQAAEQLVEAIPAWKDDKRQKADKERLRDYAMKSGFSEEEIARAYDPRVLIWGHKARLYDEMMGKQVRPQPQLGARTVPAGASNGGQYTSKTARVAKLKQQVRKSGNVKDGIAALEALL
jgi:hypothetical protein